jgi:hypothetical protein
MRAARALGLVHSFALAALATLAVTVNESGDQSHPARFTEWLLALIALHGLRYMRFWIGREIALILGFVSYALLTLIWTLDMRTATGTLPVITNFVLTLILFGALVAYHDLRALLAGMFVGFVMAAVWYTRTSGFPLSYPDQFSYNTIAGMYLFGLFVAVLFSAYMRWRILPIAVAPILLLLIAATTSIKTNLGTAIGITVATLLYFKVSIRELVRTGVFLAICAGAIVYGVKSNPALTERVQHGYARISTGLAVLTHREGDSGATGLGNRQGWEKAGLKGWAISPVFGHGVEAFRAEHGTTSHSTPIDLLFNAGIIGCGLFYAAFASIAWRLLIARNRQARGVRARITACLIAYLFISISGLIYYEQFVAIFIALSSGLLMRLERVAEREADRDELTVGDAGGSVVTA